MSKVTKKSAEAIKPLPAVEASSNPAPAQGSEAVVSRDKVMERESALMKAAADFGRNWGCDQREHPRSYWLELHIARWGELAGCALEYADCFGEPLNERGRR